jgi:hypothetical protein
VAALAALMEGVRHHENSGAFDAELLGRTGEALVCSGAASPDALSFLITKYLPLADVRCGACFGTAQLLACIGLLWCRHLARRHDMQRPVCAQVPFFRISSLHFL